MTSDERDRDYWKILGVTLFWVMFLWLAAEAWLEWIR